MHDHPGKLSAAWYAVKAAPPFQPPPAGAWLQAGGPANGWQPGALPEGMGRLDLGLIEMVLTIPLALAFWWLWRSKPRQYGFFAGYMCIAYAPVRFVLDFLRIAPEDKMGESDPRYLGLTPAQYACFGLVILGILIVRAGRKYAPVPATYEEMQEAARAALLEAEEEAEAKAEGGTAKKPKASADSTPKKTKKKKKRAKVPATEAKSDPSADTDEKADASDAAEKPSTSPDDNADDKAPATATATKGKSPEPDESEPSSSEDEHA